MARHRIDVAGDQNAIRSCGDCQDIQVGRSIRDPPLRGLEINGGFAAAQSADDFGIDIGVRLKTDVQDFPAGVSRRPCSKRFIMPIGSGFDARNSS